MKIKTFPLRFVDSELDRIGECAKKLGITKETFMMDAVFSKALKTEKELAGNEHYKG